MDTHPEKRGKSGNGANRVRSGNDHSNFAVRFPNSQCFKTKLCSFNMIGQCTRQNCSFAHCATEVREAPDLTKTKVCNNWKQGNCVQGEACRFAHGNEDLRQHPDRLSRPHKNLSNRVWRQSGTSVNDPSKGFIPRDTAPPCQNRRSGNNSNADLFYKPYKQRQGRNIGSRVKIFSLAAGSEEARPLGADKPVSVTTCQSTRVTDNDQNTTNHTPSSYGSYSTAQQHAGVDMDYFIYSNGYGNNGENYKMDSDQFHTETAQQQQRGGGSSGFPSSDISADGSATDTDSSMNTTNCDGPSSHLSQPWSDASASVSTYPQSFGASLTSADPCSPRAHHVRGVASAPGSTNFAGSLDDNSLPDGMSSVYSGIGVWGHYDPPQEYFGNHQLQDATAGTRESCAHENVEATTPITKSLATWLAGYKDPALAAHDLEACCPGRYLD
eukprot:Selendium_serpulae@DN3362_c0_g1_i1.p1